MYRLLSVAFTITLIILCAPEASADSSSDSTSSLKYSAYIDVYSAKYSDEIDDGSFQKFPTISPRSRSIGLNAIVLSADYTTSIFRATVGLHYGDIASSVWSTDYNYLVEAHGGVQIVETLWLDAGFFRSYFGTEGVYPKENFCSSVSIPTYYEPYFESGARLNYQPSNVLALTVYLLNGYNVFKDNNSSKSFGFLGTYVLSDQANIGYSNYLGDDSPTSDSVSHFRFYNNLFLNYEVKGLKVQLGVDYYLQKHSTLAADSVTLMLNDSAIRVEDQRSKVAHLCSALFSTQSTFSLRTFPCMPDSKPCKIQTAS